MAGWLGRVVDVRAGEARLAVQAFAALFLLIAGHTILETARDALFLGTLPPERLAWVYGGLAVLALGASAVNTRIVRSFGQRNALVVTLMLAAYGTAMLYLQQPSAPMVYGLYLWSGLLGPVLAVQFWMMAGRLFTVSQGRRLFGPVAAGGVMGAAAGAGAAALALSRVHVQSLLAVSATLFLVAAILLTTIASASGSNISAAVRDVPSRVPLRGAAALLRENPYVVRLAVVVVACTAMTLFVDYLFKSATRGMPPAALGPFFARYYAIVNAVALVVQLFVASRVVQRFGVASALAVTPLLVLLGGAGALVTGGALALVLVARGADGTLRHSLHRVSQELAWMPVESDARDRAKLLVDTVLGRIAQAAAAAVILGLAAFGLSTPTVLAGIVVGLASVAVLAALALRKPYLDQFRRALTRGSVEPVALGTELDVGSVEALVEALSSREPARVVAAMGMLAETGRVRLIPALILYHDSETVLLKALDLLGPSGRSDWPSLAERLLKHESESVRVAAVRALAAAGSTSALGPALEDASVSVRARATVALMRAEQVAVPSDDLRVVAMLEGSSAEERAALADAIRDHGDAAWADTLLCLLRDPEGLVVEHAASATARVQDGRFLPLLIGRLAVREGRAAVREALVALAEPALAALERTLVDPIVDRRVRVHVPRTIARFRSQRAGDVLLACLLSDADGQLRYKALKGLGRLVADGDATIDIARLDDEIRRNVLEHLRIVVLRGALDEKLEAVPAEARGSLRLLDGLLDDKMRYSLERVFRLLQMVHRHEDLRRVYASLGSTDQRVRANAREFLEVLTLGAARGAGAELRDLVRLAADELTLRERAARARPVVGLELRDRQGALRVLLRDEDASIAALAAYHASEAGLTGMESEVESAWQKRPAMRRPVPARPNAPPRLAPT